MKDHAEGSREKISGFVNAFIDLISVYRTRQLKLWGVQDFIRQFAALERSSESDQEAFQDKVRLAESYCQGLRRELTEETGLLDIAEDHLIKLKASLNDAKRETGS